MPDPYVPPAGDVADLRFSAPVDVSHPVALRFGADAPAVDDADGVLLAVLNLLPSVAVVGQYDNAVPRGLRSEGWHGWGVASRSGGDVVVPWGLSAVARHVADAGWRDAAASRGDVAVPAGRMAQSRADVAGVSGHAYRCIADASAEWALMGAVRDDVAAGWVLGDRTGIDARADWSEMLHQRAALDVLHEVARPVRLQWLARQRQGVVMRGEMEAPWGLGVKPGAGHVVIVPPGPVPAGCYVPPAGGAVEVVFSEAWSGASARAVFRCRLIDLPAQYLIPWRVSYVAVHSIQALRLPDLLQITLESCTLATDADGFCWSLSGTGSGALRGLLAPESGVPAQVRVVIDGMPWVFVVEHLARERRFGEWRTSVRGRSVAALLGAPYAPVQSWTNASARTAVQLLDDAVVGSGIDVDASLIDDWLVPAGAWSHSGTPLSAVLRIAEAIGAVVVSDRSAPTLRLMPRYPLMPWEWSGAAVAPDVRMPLAVVESDSSERRDAPEYNRAVVSGESQGVLGIITRSGSGGTLPAPMVTDALATAQAAVLQRGRAILGAAGAQELVTHTMPVLTGAGLPGVLSLGQLVETIDPDETWRGIVRGVSLRASLPQIRQTVVLERHHVTAV